MVSTLQACRYVPSRWEHITQQDADRYSFNGLPKATQQALLNRKETKYDLRYWSSVDQAREGEQALLSDGAYDANPDED